MLSRAGIIVCLFSHRTPHRVLSCSPGCLPGFSAVTQSIYLCCVLLFYILHYARKTLQSRSICDDSIENACQVILYFSPIIENSTIFQFFPNKTRGKLKKSSVPCRLRRIFFDGHIVKMTVKEIYSTN